MYMLEQMTLTLAGGGDEVAMSNLLKSLGQEKMDRVFPDYPMLIESPIIPAGTPWDFKPLPIPAPVSYTHLDVYKRQVLYSDPERIAALLQVLSLSPDLP